MDTFGKRLVVAVEAKFGRRVAVVAADRFLLESSFAWTLLYNAMMEDSNLLFEDIHEVLI